jgi:hypothetical protein
MQDHHKNISLGFTPQTFSPGVHVCQILSSDDEREDSLLQFILSGIRSHERTSCFSSKTSERKVEVFLRHHDISYVESRDQKLLSLSNTEDVYFKDNRFEPDEMLRLLQAFYEEAIGMGYSAARVIGEMSPDIQHVEGGSRLLEYESRVSMLQRQYPVTAVCQYDARMFDGATIMDILKVHPLMVVRGTVVHNPFYVKPEEVLNLS